MSMKPSSYYRERYVRHQPLSFCPGCGNGIILNCFARAVDNQRLDQDKLLCVSGIGCSAWIPNPHFNSDTLHTTHGRALAFATGAKVFNSELTVVVFTGDGDGAGIGGNHLIHAARRNIGITTILVNNLSYTMTGGQIAPTTFHDSITSTSPYGNPENPFDLCKLVAAAGATYVARWTAYHIVELTRSIEEAIENRGFSFIEALSPCPTRQRRLFGLRGPIHEVPSKIMEMFAESSYIRGRISEKDYCYAVPKSSPERALEEVEEELKRGNLEAKVRLVDHMKLGAAIRIDCEPGELDSVKSLLKELAEVKEVIGALEEKIELGTLVREKRPEFTESLREIIRRAGGA